MSTLRRDVTDYLATRRAMGYKADGLRKLLLSFVTFCEAHGASHVRNDLAVQWATTPIRVPVTDALIARRMDAVQIFARHQHALDPDTQIPPDGIGNRRYQPREPNVFTEAQVLALMTAADTLTPPFKAATWRTQLIRDPRDRTTVGLRVTTSLNGQPRRTLSQLLRVLHIRHDRRDSFQEIWLPLNQTALLLDVWVHFRPGRLGRCPPRLRSPEVGRVRVLRFMPG